MDIGIGVPGYAPWTNGRDLVEWARRAEAHGFSTVAVSDRLLWSTPEPLVALAALGGATTEIKLLTSVLLAPLRTNHLLFAKAVTTLDQLVGPGRLQLGLAAGFRDDDFVASGVDLASRGRLFGELLDCLLDMWDTGAGTGLRPATPGGPALLFGGDSDAAVRRIAAHGTGWVAGTASPDDLDAFTPRLQGAWSAGGRAGAPRVVASVTFALGPGAEAAVAAAIGPYYAFAGEEAVRYGLVTAVTTPLEVTEAVADFEKAGCDELIFTGNDPDPAQVDLLADALGW